MYGIFTFINVDIYVNIPYMDPMGLVIAVLTGRISRVVCFLRIFAEMLGAEPA